MADVKELNINNTTYDIKAKSVVDTNSGAVKMWTGTKAQYDAIVIKDANTLYNITDDTDVTLSLLELLYPVGSIYIGTMVTCPLQTLGVGTWQLKTSRFLVDKYSNGTDWWELYSDGWFIQGGIALSGSTGTINLAQSYINTDYSVLANVNIQGTAGDNVIFTFQVRVKSTDNFTYAKIYQIGNTSGLAGEPFAWQTEGYTSQTTQLKQWERIS